MPENSRKIQILRIWLQGGSRLHVLTAWSRRQTAQSELQHSDGPNRETLEKMSLTGEIQEDFLEEGMPVMFGRRKGESPLFLPPPPRS